MSRRKDGGDKRAPVPQMSVQQKCDILQGLVDGGVFGTEDPVSIVNQNSIEYHAAMYYLISILETRMREDEIGFPRKYEGLNRLRNGLVHGHAAIDALGGYAITPESLRHFVNRELIHLKKNDGVRTDMLKSYPLYKRVARYDTDVKKSSVAAQERTLRCLSTGVDAAADCRNTMAENKAVLVYILDNYGLEAIREDYILAAAAKHVIACFGETQQNELDVIQNGRQVSNNPECNHNMDTIRSLRNKVFHDTGTQDFTDQVIDAGKILTRYNPATGLIDPTPQQQPQPQGSPVQPQQQPQAHLPPGQSLPGFPQQGSVPLPPQAQPTLQLQQLQQMQQQQQQQLQRRSLYGVPLGFRVPPPPPPPGQLPYGAPQPGQQQFRVPPPPPPGFPQPGQQRFVPPPPPSPGFLQPGQQQFRVPPPPPLGFLQPGQQQFRVLPPPPPGFPQPGQQRFVPPQSQAPVPQIVVAPVRYANSEPKRPKPDQTPPPKKDPGSKSPSRRGSRDDNR